MIIRKVFSVVFALLFCLEQLSWGQSPLVLPSAGGMIVSGTEFQPAVLKGLKVYPKEPLRFDFILDPGERTSADAGHLPAPSDDELKRESAKLVRYFLASLTVPEKDLWVNLSPYEKDRIIPEAFGQTEMGRDLLEQDYILKQLTSSLLYPEGETGRRFWQKVYALAQEKYGTTDIPIDTFNKVWIVPEKAEVYSDAGAGAAYIAKSRLKVMLETDYLATSNNALSTGGHAALLGNVSPSPLPGDSGLNVKATQGNPQPPNHTENDIAKAVLREVVIPVLEKEVNEGESFARLRQVYQSLILATWYKKKIRQSLLSEVYVDRNKTAGVNIEDPKEAEKIWQRYAELFRKGAYNLIREEKDVYSDEMIPRKYFSGGWSGRLMLVEKDASQIPDDSSPVVVISVHLKGVGEAVLASKVSGKELDPGEWWRQLHNRTAGPQWVALPLAERHQLLRSTLLRVLPQKLSASVIDEVLRAFYVRGFSADTGYEEKLALLADLFIKTNAGKQLLDNPQLEESGLEGYMVLLSRLVEWDKGRDSLHAMEEVIRAAPVLAGLQEAARLIGEGTGVNGLLLRQVLGQVLLRARSLPEAEEAFGLFVRTMGMVVASEESSVADSVARDVIVLFRSVTDLEYFNITMRAFESYYLQEKHISRAIIGNSDNLLKGNPSIFLYQNMWSRLLRYRLVDGDISRLLVERQTNMWPMQWEALPSGRGMGVGGFAYKCLSSVPSPSGIHELLMDLRDLPSTSAALLEQNRKDAYVFNRLNFKGRDFIHDQTPGVHQILLAWLRYYDSGGRRMEPRPAYIANYAVWPPTEEDKGDRNSIYFRRDVMAALDSYVNLDSRSHPEKAIDIIRRLARNTRPVKTAPPKVYNESGQEGFSGLDKALQDLFHESSGETDTFYLFVALREANRVLRQMDAARQPGVMPNLIMALAWLEEKTASALRAFRDTPTADYYKEDLYRTPWFQESLEFFFRTHTPHMYVSADYFHGRDYLLEKEHGKVYRRLSMLVLASIKKWTQLNNANGRSHFNEALWSGGLADALLMVAGMDTAAPGTHHREGAGIKNFIWGVDDTRGGIDFSAVDPVLGVSSDNQEEVPGVFSTGELQQWSAVPGFTAVLDSVLFNVRLSDFLGL